MHDAIRAMMNGYNCVTQDDYINALREILQQAALLGLWRSKFFEHAAFYGGTALRVLYGLDRFSEDLDFSLLKPDQSFSMNAYGESLRREIGSFGFDVDFESRQRDSSGQIKSAFLKASAFKQMIVIEAPGELLGNIHPAKLIKIRLEVDVDPPGGFETETQYVLQPIPFAVRVYSLPDLFAGKLHAVLCRKWRNRVKGRDWYDMIWYIGRYPVVNISHLDARMRQSGDYNDEAPLTLEKLHLLLTEAVGNLNIDQARIEASPFVRYLHSLDIWSEDFFRQIIKRITVIE